MCCSIRRSPAYLAVACGRAEAEGQSTHAGASDVWEGLCFEVGGGGGCCCLIMIIVVVIARIAGRIIVTGEMGREENAITATGAGQGEYIALARRISDGLSYAMTLFVLLGGEEGHGS